LVVDYSNIFESVKEQIPEQDWSDRSWSTIHEGTSVQIFRDSWGDSAGEGIHYYCYGQGDDPEQNPIILELVLGDEVEEREATANELSDRLEGDMKDIIGWVRPEEEDVFMRKELPSDPLTLLPRILEELKKLEVVSRRIDETYAESTPTG